MYHIFVFVLPTNMSESGFDVIYSQVIEAQVDMPIVGAITIYTSLLTFTLRVHPDRLDYVDLVLVCLSDAK